MNSQEFCIGIITCDRPNFVKTLIHSLENVCENLFVVNDGDQDISTEVEVGYYLKTKKEKSGVGKAKNIALQQFMKEKDCDNFFLLEDDIIIKDVSVFQKYIEASKITGIQHFNFAFHGVDNYTLDGTPAIRLQVDYTENCSICLYPNVYGALSFYTRKCIEECGYMDECYYNALEHVDHTNKVIKKRMHPPFRWFADIANSSKYIAEQDSNHSESMIRRDQDWVNNFHKMADYFLKQNGFDVRDPHARTATKEDVVNSLKEIKKLWKK